MMKIALMLALVCGVVVAEEVEQERSAPLLLRKDAFKAPAAPTVVYGGDYSYGYESPAPKAKLNANQLLDVFAKLQAVLELVDKGKFTAEEKALLRAEVLRSMSAVIAKFKECPSSR